mgnify:CR=1 FL=1
MNFTEFENIIGYEFKNKAYLETALTHSSYLNEHKDCDECYERLEFLGDSVLQLVSGEYLFSEFSDRPEGELTKHRAARVCEKALCLFAKELGIRLPPGKAVSFGQNLFWAPEEMPDLRRLKVMRPGLELGIIKKDRFEPAHALALWLKETARTEDLTPESAEIQAFMRGETIESSHRGWTLVTVGGFSIGWGKGDGKVLKNHYPKGLRR